MTRRLGGIVVAACLAGGLAGGATLQVESFKPITDAVLLDPDPSDWINWRRTLDGWGYSPSTGSPAENVATLQLVWSWGQAARHRRRDPPRLRRDHVSARPA